MGEGIMRNITLVYGERRNGKTYAMVKKMFELAYRQRNVVIIGENPRFQLYVKEILEKEYPNIKKVYKHNQIIVNDERIMYVLTPFDVDNYEQLESATDLLIDDFYTLYYLVKNKKFMQRVNTIQDIVVTVPSYYFHSIQYKLDDLMRMFRNRLYMKVEWTGYDV